MVKATGNSYMIHWGLSKASLVVKGFNRGNFGQYSTSWIYRGSYTAYNETISPNLQVRYFAAFKYREQWAKGIVF